MLSLAVAIGVPLSVGVFGSVFSSEGIRTWWPTLSKPAWTPPNRVFGPVWSVLYTAMGYASWRVWSLVGFRPAALWATYAIQLILNAAWNPLMFAGRKIDVAFMDIVALFLFAASCGLQFGQVDKVAGMLFVPYLCWCAFAAVLNWELLRRNPKQALSAAPNQTD